MWYLVEPVWAAAAASISQTSTSLGPRTFVALNNDTAGFQEASNAVIEITGFSSSLTSLVIA
ncbi:bluetail domain-containing putative surface protein [Nodosilinea sp. FACHB-13]|uniref:bluetail domain-containing putative surface protein n=1 Tax=Cyanophyceae TaxID=3028117 RepID=UPI0024140AD3|nr:bluetail domain-containing putative surface protein [Nodosilinea sp. FACHB-13]